MHRFILHPAIVISHTVQDRADRILDILGKLDLSNTFTTIFHLHGSALVRRALGSALQFKVFSSSSSGIVVIPCLALDAIIMRDHGHVSMLVEEYDHVGVVLWLWLRFGEFEVSGQLGFWGEVRF